MSRRTFVAALSLALTLAASAWAQPTTLFSSRAEHGIPAGGPYVPPGGLYDNEQSNGTTSLASQDSSGTTTARSADDFLIPAGACASGQFDITQIRIQMVQSDVAPQAFAVDLFADGGGTPTPTNSISPISTTAQDTQTLLGPFGVGTSIFEASFLPVGMVLDADTTYWISGYGTNAALNAAGFNNFFAASAGAAATTDNGMLIAPGSGVPTWTPAHIVIGGDPLAFSFAIDGTCAVAGGGTQTSFDVAVPTLGNIGLVAMLAALALAGFLFLRRA